jgi:hypoxanthine phosphoribosyltransferase
MNLFQNKEFFSHSGELLTWKIDCDALTDEDIEALAFLIGERFGFKKVISVPRGGGRLAEALKKYEDDSCWAHLLVDDVLTTGLSMEEARQEIHVQNPGKSFPQTTVMGVVIFSRMFPGEVPDWINPIFQIWGQEHPDKWLSDTIRKDMESRGE